MSGSRRRFRPALIPTLVTLILFPILVGLGFWQLDRAQQKRAIQAEYDARSNESPVNIGPLLQDAETLRFYRVMAKGSYEPDYQVLIDNRIQDGRVGYYVITPLRIQGSDMRVLVNRGWVPLGASRQDLPKIETPTGSQAVTGVATVPSARVFQLAEPAPITDEWQIVWQHMDMKRYESAVPFSIQPVVILLDPDSSTGGFDRQWMRLDAGIAVHQGYAFQWFMLAVALLVIYVVVNLRLRAGRSGGQKPDVSDPRKDGS